MFYPLTTVTFTLMIYPNEPEINRFWDIYASYLNFLLEKDVKRDDVTGT